MARVSNRGHQRSRVTPVGLPSFQEYFSLQGSTLFFLQERQQATERKFVRPHVRVIINTFAPTWFLSSLYLCHTTRQDRYFREKDVKSYKGDSAHTRTLHAFYCSWWNHSKNCCFILSHFACLYLRNKRFTGLNRNRLVGVRMEAVINVNASNVRGLSLGSRSELWAAKVWFDNGGLHRLHATSLFHLARIVYV